MRSYNPTRLPPWFGLVRFRSPLLTESRFLSFPPGTEMFQFPGFARGSRDQRSLTAPPGLSQSSTPFRLLAPRHPPHALTSLAASLTPSYRHLALLREMRATEPLLGKNSQRFFARFSGSCRATNRLGPGVSLYYCTSRTFPVRWMLFFPTRFSNSYPYSFTAVGSQSWGD